MKQIISILVAVITLFASGCKQSSYQNKTDNPMYSNGKLVYNCPNIDQIRTYCLEQVDTLWDEVKRFDNPHTYYVDLSQKLWDIKYRLLKEKNKK